MAWKLNKNRKHEILERNGQLFDVYWAVNAEFGILFFKDDLEDPIGEFSRYCLANLGYKFP